MSRETAFPILLTAQEAAKLLKVEHRQLVLNDREAGFGEGCGLVESAALGADIAVDIPVVESVTW
jgi:hypothetical protein